MLNLAKILGLGMDGGAAKGGPNKTVGLVANRFLAPTTTGSVPLNYTSRRQHFAHPDGAISNFRTVDCTFVFSSITADQAATRTIKRYIEYPAGVFTQVTWGGNPTVAMSTSVAISDPINLTIPAGAEFWERTVNVGGAVSLFPLQQLPASSQTLGSPDGNSASDQGNSGTIAATSTQTTFGSTAMIGDIAKADAKSYVIFGDSLAWGEGDVSSVSAKGASGFLARALEARGYPYLKIAKQGQQAADIVASPTRIQALLDAIQYSDVIVEHGVNDLRLGRTQAQLLADHQTIYGYCTGKRITQTTITPRSSSTDGWATTANQTPKTDGTMSSITSVNAAIRAKPANVSVVLDAADAAMSARDSNIWTAPPAATLDGTHPTTVKATAMGTALSFA
jgi:lysophospholipase L1-like esterase